MSNPETDRRTKAKLFYPTDQKSDLLENIARHELITIDQLLHILAPDITDPKKLDTRRSSISRTLREELEPDKLVAHRQFTPDDYPGRGTTPSAYWLLEDGEEFCRQEFPATDPKHHGPKLSELNIPHNILRTETRIALFEMCARLAWQIGCRKTDLFHFVKPDDFYEFTLTKTAHLFLEEERKKKDYKQLYDKCLPYVKYRGTPQFKKAWGFAYYNAIIPMPDEEARQSIIIHFAGGCDCIDRNHKEKHKRAPFKLISDTLWFTTHDLITTNPEGNIFLTPADYETSTHSFLDIVK